MSKDIIQCARALDFAARKHVHQRRKGELEEPYINHLAEVTQMLAAAPRTWPELRLLAEGVEEVGADTFCATIVPVG